MLKSSMTVQNPVRPGSPVFGPDTEELREELAEELPDEPDPCELDPDELAVHFAYSVRFAVTGVLKSYAFRHCASVYQPPKV